MYCKIEGNSGISLSERWKKEEQERLAKVNKQIHDLLSETNFRLEERIRELETLLKAEREYTDSLLRDHSHHMETLKVVK